MAGGMAKQYGWAGQVLRVDLTDGKITRVPTAEYKPEKFIGGLGLNTKIFWDMGCPRVGALDEDNPLIFSVGPMMNTVGPFQRATISGISPQPYPAELFSYSSIGGRWGAYLKSAGYDALVISGKAEKPVYLSINDADVQIKDASDLWGVDAIGTGEALLGKATDAASMCIGPSGENLSPISIILCETGNASGIGGYGAVMGSKNLKAIRIRGTGSVRIARPGDWLKLISAAKEDGYYKLSPKFPTRFPPIPDPAKTQLLSYSAGISGCYGCLLQCWRKYKLPGIGMGMAMCAQSKYGFFDPGDASSAWEMNMLCQKIGVNVNEVCNIFTFLFLCKKEGILKEKDFKNLGLPLNKFLGGAATGHEFLVALLYPIASGKSIFANGLHRAIEHFGKEAFEIYKSLYTAWGCTIHYVDSIPAALCWALDTRDPVPSSRDLRIFPSSESLAAHFGVAGGEAITNNPEKAVYDGAESTAAFSAIHQSLRNSLPICQFVSPVQAYFKPPEMDIRIFESKAFSAVTGIDMGVSELWKAGERIWNLRRAVMVKREQRTRKEDTVSDISFERKWLVNNTIPVDIEYEGNWGARLGGPLDRGKIEALKDRYYELAGWDVKTGWPTRAKLQDLGLADVADEMEIIGISP